MAKYIVLLGAPGAGKGTQAVRISRGLNLPHISSGDIFRENLKQKTDLGNQAKTFMNPMPSFMR
jgi:adenylate kinase